MAGLTKRQGNITNTRTAGNMFIMNADAPLSQMFGYASEIRSLTGGTGEFSMEYKRHSPVSPQDIKTLMDKYKKKQQSR